MRKNYVRLFMKYILLLVVITTDVTTQVSADGLTYTCDANGHISSIQQSGIVAEQIAIEKTNKSYCHYSEDSCKAEALGRSKLHVMIQSDLKKRLLGGKQEDIKHYTIECKEEYDVTAKADPFKVSPPVKVRPEAITKTPPTLSLNIKKAGDGANLQEDVSIGEKLTLQMSSSAYNVIPKKCTAINADDPTDKVEIWAYKSDKSDGKCSTFDSAITIEKWNVSIQTKITSISIYAFQFTSSPNVIISCSAHLCLSSKPTCSESCMDSVTRRRRRSSQILQKEQQGTKTEEAQVYFRVVTENIVHNQANALYVSFTVLITAIIFGERLARFV